MKIKDIKKSIKKIRKEKPKEYSRINEIKVYNGKDNLVDGTLVLEGGAFRGLYTAGVLDCLIDNDINLTNVIGISAGALNGANYLAGNRGRSAIAILKNRFNPHYVGLKAYRESGSVVGFKYLFEDLNEECQINEDRLYKGDRNLYVGATNLSTGKTDYFKIDNHDIYVKACTASASMPLVSKMVKIGNNKYLDGGCETKLPIRYAIDNKFQKIVFVGTRPLSYRRKKTNVEIKLETKRYFRYPNFLTSLKNANKRYNLDAEFLEQLANKKAIFTVCPSEPVKVSRLEKDVEKLGELYMLGYSDTQKVLPELKEYLNIK